MVESDRFVQRVVLHQVKRHMPAAARQAERVQLGLVGRGTVLRRACELDAVIAHLRHRGQRAGHIRV